MKIKRVKDRVLGANQKHVMLSGVEGKTLMITRVEFYNLVRANELKKGEYHRDDVGLAIFKKISSKCCPAFGRACYRRSRYAFIFS